jgi:hypothetical protein
MREDLLRGDSSETLGYLMRFPDTTDITPILTILQERKTTFSPLMNDFVVTSVLSLNQNRKEGILFLFFILFY